MFFQRTVIILGRGLGSHGEPFGLGRGVVRMGYGLFYGRLPGATISSALANTALTSVDYQRADLTDDGYRLSAGCKSGVRICVFVFDNTRRLLSGRQLQRWCSIGDSGCLRCSRGSFSIERELGAGDDCERDVSVES